MAGTISSSDVVTFTDKVALSRDAAHRFVSLAARKTNQGENFTVALAGGSTPLLLYTLLSTSTFSDSILWAKVHCFFGDERCVSPSSSDSNYRMAQQTLLSVPELPTANIHRMPADLPDQDAAALQYETELKEFFGADLPRFDLILLGMGPDGHCASLFPNKPALQERKRLVVATEPGFPPLVSRLTLTLPILNNAANLVFLVAGEDKSETLGRVLEGPNDPEALPSQAIQPTDGTLTWLIDRPASRSLLQNQS